MFSFMCIVTSCEDDVCNPQESQVTFRGGQAQAKWADAIMEAVERSLRRCCTGLWPRQQVRRLSDLVPLLCCFCLEPDAHPLLPPLQAVPAHLEARHKETKSKFW